MKVDCNARRCQKFVCHELFKILSSLFLILFENESVNCLIQLFVFQ